MSNTEPQSILSTYFIILFHKGIEKFKNSFIENQVLRNFQYQYIEEYNYFMKEEMIEDNGFAPIFTTDIIKKEDFLKRLLELTNDKIFQDIDAKIILLKEQDKLIFLSTVYDELVVLLKKLNSFFNNDDINLIEESLIELVNYLKEKYPVVDYHTAHKYLIKESDLYFFKNKDLKYQFYIELYELASDLYIIDDIETDEQTFIEALTNPKPQLLVDKVRFVTKNNITAYFLKTLKPFFKNFTYNAIEISCVFLNKQNKPLKANDIEVALSRGKEKDIIEKNKITSHIQELKNKYLN